MANPPQPTLRLDEAGEPRRLGPQPLLRRWRARLTALAWFVFIVLMISPFIGERPYPTAIGTVARSKYEAPTDVEVVDQDATNQALEELKKIQVWRRDTKAEERIQQKIGLLFAGLNAMHGKEPTVEEINRFVKTMADTHEISTNYTTVQDFLNAQMTLKAIQREMELIVQSLLYDRCIIANLDVGYRAQYSTGHLRLMVGNEEKKQLPSPDSALNYPIDRMALAREVNPHFVGEGRSVLRQPVIDQLISILEPNIVYDEKLTAGRHANEREQLSDHPIMKKYSKGDVIVDKGQTINRLQAAALAKLEAQRHATMARKMIGIICLAGVFFAAIAVYLKRFRRETSLDASTITLHVLPPVVALVIGQMLLVWQGTPTMIVMVWFPSALVGMLSSILITPQVAFVLVLTTACLFGVSAGLDLQFMIIALFGGFTAVLASRDIRSRIDILRVGIKVGLVNMVALTIMTLANPNWLGASENPSAFFSRLLISGFLNGVGCSLATLILLVVFEWAFGIVTDLRLLELTGLKHPLIRQLEMKAPGTYQHTLNVAKLAEAAADAIGANTLLVRAGTYFHDIGKMAKPKYFSENQQTLDDKKAHSKLSPNMSTLIIKSHVKEGMELARAFKLPQKVIDFIPQHHGTGLIRYFYQEALKRYENSEAVDPVREEDFRYPGPKPQSIEAALLLLADSVEAISASRFISGQVNEDELRRTVQYAISEKFNDGQFDECNLTMSHLYRIREALVAALMARYHFRIAYPTPPPKPKEPTTTQISVSGPAGS